jgi:hypothetical protein
MGLLRNLALDEILIQVNHSVHVGMCTGRLIEWLILGLVLGGGGGRGGETAVYQLTLSPLLPNS